MCNFYMPITVHIYAGLQIFIQLTATLMKLCHIKRKDFHRRIFTIFFNFYNLLEICYSLKLSLNIPSHLKRVTTLPCEILMS